VCRLRRMAVVNQALGRIGRVGPAGVHPHTCALRLHAVKVFSRSQDLERLGAVLISPNLAGSQRSLSIHQSVDQTVRTPSFL
jgi:hypothetical protein